MSRLKENCPSCGAPGAGRICEFCGTLLAVPINTSEEKEALNDFHHLLAGQDEAEKRVAFLQHGFIPEDPSNLIDAGVRSVALIDFNADEDEPGNAAANRLRAIMLKLKIMEAPTPDITRAISEFERVLNKHEHIEKRDSIIGWVLLAVIGIVLIGACFFAIAVML
ncbi:MAG: hypothetical protein GY755_20445 [Chloroflexi bacterium]|nr:hypothetical protein [Chloroflexota bacterium]